LFPALAWTGLFVTFTLRCFTYVRHRTAIPIGQVSVSTESSGVVK
jgi:hypothetical protein